MRYDLNTPITLFWLDEIPQRSDDRRPDDGDGVYNNDYCIAIRWISPAPHCLLRSRVWGLIEILINH